MTISLPHRVFAVDPATGESGWAILDLISINPLKIKIVATGQLSGDKLVKLKKEMTAALFQRQFCILDALLDEYERLINLYKPDQVVSEGAFGFNHMSAFLAISLAINTLRMASKKILFKDLIIVPPSITKIAMTGKGGADKDHMRLAYQTNSYLEGVVADEFISEHEIDAIGHGCAYIRRDIVKDIVQISAKEKKAAKQLRKAKALAKKESMRV